MIKQIAASEIFKIATKKIGAGLLGLFLFFNSHAQNYSFDNYTVQDNGIVQSNITAIVQDKSGDVWLGTESGVSRVNGKSVQNYSTSNGLADNNVTAMFLDKVSNIWIAHKNGSLTKYDGFKFEEMKSEFLPVESEIFSLNQDKKGSLWLSTAKYGAIQIIDPYGDLKDKNNFKNYTSKNGLSEFCFSSFEDDQGNIWFSTDVGIKVLNVKTSKIDYLRIDKMPPFLVTSLMYDNRGFVWLGFLNGQVSRYDIKNDNITNYTEKDGLPMVATSVMSSSNGKVFNHVNGLMKDGDGNIWIAIWDKGVVRFNGDDKKEKFTTFNSQNGLSINRIRALAFDREKNILLGTYGNGLSIFKGERFVSYNKTNGVIGNSVWAITQDKKGRYWWGTNEGITVYDPNTSKDKAIKSYSQFASLSTNSVRDFAIDVHGNIWVATWGSKIVIYDIEKESFHINEQINNLTNTNVASIESDKSGKIWIGTVDGITVFDVKNNEIKTYRTVDGLSSNDISCIYSDSKNRIWIGTKQHGICVFENNKFTRYDKSNGLSFTRISSIAEDKTGDIWIGTEGGGIFLLKNKVFKNFKIKDGLNSDFITSLTVDDKNNLWVGSNNGLNKVDINKEYFFSYTKYDGFSGIETKNNAVFKDKQANLWFGTVNGVYRYDPLNDVKNELEPLLKITKLKVNLKDIEVSDTLELSYLENSLKIDFIGICFANPEAVLYKVKLGNYDLDWKPASKQIFEIYSNLSPGEYIFNVVACNNNGVWNKNPVTIYIKINPPFWQTWWFISLCIVVGFATFFSYIKIREKNLVKEKQVLEKKVEQRTAEIAEQKKEIEEKNNDITASIRYAKRIQDAILPPDEYVKKYLPKTFILFKPKDIVSGDFYWVHDKKDKILFAAVDCTGHGVPGAFMSIVGHNHLEQIVANQNLTKPSEIMDALNKSVSDTLRQTNTDEKVKDGMDMALCMFDRTTHIFEYSGAFNPLWLIRNGELIETKADKFPIGNLKIGEEKKFTNHSIQLIQGDTLYVFSDGFADQFGGPAGKKLKYSTFKKMLLDTQHMNMEEQGEYLKSAIEQWQGKLEQVDDILVIGTRL